LYLPSLGSSLLLYAFTELPLNLLEVHPACLFTGDVVGVFPQDLVAAARFDELNDQPCLQPPLLLPCWGFLDSVLWSSSFLPPSFLISFLAVHMIVPIASLP